VTKPWGRAAVEAVDYLAERGYQWFEFDEDGRIFPHARLEQYPEIKNYLAVPREKLSAIEGLRVR
jgi:hypothetical protein